MIIVEGADNSGKTTLVRKIRNEFPHLIPMKGQGPKNNYLFWVQNLRTPPEDLVKMMWDRFYFSELAYGTVIRKRVNLTLQQNEVLESLLLAADPLIIHCHLIDDEKGFNSREQLFTWEQNKEVDEFYSRVLKGWKVTHLRGKVPFNEDFEGDWEAIGMRKTLEEITSYFLSRGPWLTFRRACSYGRGNPYNPRLMIVGERFGPNNPLKIPMERSKTGKMVHDALRANHLTMRDVWITNAIKYEEELTTRSLTELAVEHQLLQPQGTIALGKRAAGILSSLRISHTRVNHPGYYLRRGKPHFFEIDFRRACESVFGGENS